MLRFQVNNSSMQHFPDNKTLNFVTKLSRTLQLDGEWEVCLAEIVYHILGTTYAKERILWKFTLQINSIYYSKRWNTVFSLDITRKYRM